jgi:hypothetical protein
MPTDTPQKNYDDIIKGIIEGNYKALPSKAEFQEILNEFVFDLECDESQSDNQNPFDFNCIKPEGKNVIIHLFLKEILEKNQLNNAFDFFTKYIIANKNTLSDESIKKLIFLGIHYTTLYETKIKHANSTFNEKDVITTSSFINFTSSLLNIPNITEFETPGLIHQKLENSFLPNITLGSAQKIDTLVGDTIKLSTDLTHRLEFKHYPYKTENLLPFLKSLGNFGYELKVKDGFQDYSHHIPPIANIIIHSTSLSNFSKEDKELAGYTFLSGFHNEDKNQIKIDCLELLDLEDCPRPVTASIQLFQRIAAGNYNNQKPPFTDFIQVESEIKHNSDTLNQDQRIHILDFLKNVLKTNNSAENTFNFKNLFSFASNNINNLTNDLQQKNRLDDSFAKAAEYLSFFLFNIVKHNGNNEDLLGQIHIIKQFSKLYENIMIKAPYLNSLLDTMRNHLFSILARNIDSETALQTGHLDFLNIIKDLNKVCRENRKACNLSKKSAGSFKSLGSISRKASGYELSATKEAKALIESNRPHLTPTQLSDAVSFFFKANITQNDLNNKCREIFNLTGCKPSSSINLDNLINGEIDEMVTTSSLEEHLDTITPTTQIAVPISTSNQTISSVIVDSSVATEFPAYSNSTPSNQTIIDDTDANHNDTRLSNSGLTLSAAAAHGVGTGLLNGVIQYFAAKYSRQGQHASTTKTIIIYSSLLSHAAFAATFPLMLFKIQEHINQGNEDEAQQLWDNLLLQALPTFISSVGFSLGLQIVKEFTQLLSNRVVQSVAQNTLPLLGTVVSLFKNPVATAIQMSTSIATSSLINFSLNQFFSTSNWPLDLENNSSTTFQMKPLPKEEKIQIHQTAVEDKNPEKLIYFIKEVNLESLRKSLNLITLHIAASCLIYENNISALETAKENIPPNKRALLDNPFSGHLELLKSDLKTIQVYQINLGMKEIKTFRDIAYIEALKTAFKGNLIDEKAEIAANNYVDYLNKKEIGREVNYPKFLEISSEDEKYTLEQAYLKHNKACKGFSFESTLVNDQSVMELLMLIKKIKETIEKFKENLLKIEGTDTTSLPKGVFDEIKHIKDHIEFVLTEINQDNKRFESYVQAARAIQKNASNTSEESKHLRNKSISIRANRPVTFHGGSDRSSSSDESTSGISTADSMLDNADHQEKRSLVPKP